MDKILARRFAPFNFSVVPDFPNVVPTFDEWGDFLPRFRGHRDEDPAEHLLEFHQLMLRWGIHHQDALMKMFRFSLEGDAHEWFHSLPPASISSLEQFHAAFNAHCQKFYPSELICHSCCEGYNDCIQDIAASYTGCEDERDDLDQKSVLSLPYSSASEESCVCCTSEESAEIESVMETDFPYNPFSKEPKYEQPIFDSYDDAEDSPVLGAEVLGSSTEDDDEDSIVVEALHSAPDVLVVSTFDDYSDEEQQSPASQFVDLGSARCQIYKICRTEMKF
jgi:hypothetical protein